MLTLSDVAVRTVTGSERLKEPGFSKLTRHRRTGKPKGVPHGRPTSSAFTQREPPAADPGDAAGATAGQRPPGPPGLGLLPGPGPRPPLRPHPLPPGRARPPRPGPAPRRGPVAVRHPGGRRLRPRPGLPVHPPPRLPLAGRRRLRQL